MPGPHWSLEQCHFSPGAPWFLKLPPSCEFPTGRVWGYSGRRVSPEWWWGCVCSSPIAALGSGCPRRRKSSSYGNTHTPNHSSAHHLHLQNGGTMAGIDLIQCSIPSSNHLLDTYSSRVEWRVKGIGEAEEVFKAKKITWDQSCRGGGQDCDGLRYGFCKRERLRTQRNLSWAQGREK